MKKGLIYIIIGLGTLIETGKGELLIAPVVDNSIEATWWGCGWSVVTQATQVAGQSALRTSVSLESGLPDYEQYGAPAVPFIQQWILLPPGMDVGDVQIVRRKNTKQRFLDDPLCFNPHPTTGYDMADPVQAKAWAENNVEDAAIYQANAFFPDEAVHVERRYFRGYNLLSFSFTPLAYNPVQQLLLCSEYMKFDISLIPESTGPEFGLRAVPNDREIIKQMIINRQDLSRYYPEESFMDQRGGSPTNYYVIITSTNFASSFETLRAFHSHDVDHQASIVTIDSILDFYDYTNTYDQLKIRWYVRDQLYSNGTEYVLIGGDVEVVTSYWGSSDFYYSGGEIPVGRFPVDTTAQISNSTIKAMRTVSNGTDLVQFIPRADEVGPGLIQYTNIFEPYIHVDIDSSLYNAPPNELFPAMDTHTIIWARGHGYYLYPQWAPSWYEPNNTNIQPVCVNFGCSGAIFDYDDHPCEAYQRCLYGNMAYMATIADTSYHSFGIKFFESYLVDGTAGPVIGDMMLIAWNYNSLFTLMGDPRYEFVSQEFQALPRISSPRYGYYSRSYNTDSGTGVIDDITFSVNSFNSCPWEFANISCDTTLSNHIAFSCTASNESMDVQLSFLDVTNIAPGYYSITFDLRDTANSYLISKKTATLTVTDKNILTYEDFIVSGKTNTLPAGVYYLVEDLVVEDDVVVVLEPGVSLVSNGEFGGDWEIDVGMGGQLIARGTVTNVIEFGASMSGIPINIQYTDLIPLSADFAYCAFADVINGSNRPVANFVNCTLVLPSGGGMGDENLFPNPIQGIMKNCIITPAGMGAVGGIGDLSGFDISYSSICPLLTNEVWDPVLPVMITRGEHTIFGNDGVGNMGGGMSLDLLSPCINGGDPSSVLDPDGTQADMGAYYYDLSGAVHVPDDYATIAQGLQAAMAITTALQIASGDYAESFHIFSTNWVAIRIAGNDPTNRPRIIMTNTPDALLTIDGNAFLENLVLTHISSNQTGYTVRMTTDMVNVGFRNCLFEGNQGNAALFAIELDNEWARCGFYMQDVSFVNNQSNAALISIGQGLSSPSMALETWNWMKTCSFISNVNNDVIIDFSPTNRYMFTRGLCFRDNAAATLIQNKDTAPSSNTCLVLQNAFFRNNAGDIKTDMEGKLLFENCTFYQNQSNITAAGNGIINIRDTIFRDNSIIMTQELSGRLDVNYCNIDTDYPNPGMGNISTNPMFANVDADDFHLLRLSPCIDTGSPSADYANEPPPNGSRVNMGYYGNTPEATCWKMWMPVDIACTGTEIVLTFSAESNAYYQTEYASSILGPWTNYANQCCTGVPICVTYPATEQEGYFRVHNYAP